MTSQKLDRYLLPVPMVIILLYSGSVFYLWNNTELQLGMLVIAAVLTYLAHRRGKLISFVKTKDVHCLAFVYLYAFSILVNLAYESSVYQFGLYFFYEWAIVALAYLIVQCVSYDAFQRVYVNVMTVLAALSLICLSAPDVVKQIAPYCHTVDDLNYYSLFFYNLSVDLQNLSVSIRNFGPFWEPGAYQAYLIFAILLLITEKRHKFAWLKAAILVFTVFTTYSTTGYFLLVVMALLKLYAWIKPAYRTKLTIALAVLGVVCVFNLKSILEFIDQYTLYSISDKLFSANSSLTTRLYSGACDLEIALTHPFGVDRLDAEALRMSVAPKYGAVTASTNTFTSIALYFGWLAGAAHAWLWIRGCHRYQSHWTSRLLVLGTMAVILITELYVDLWFFWIIAMYWNSGRASENPTEGVIEAK